MADPARQELAQREIDRWPLAVTAKADGRP
jgi:hypothetical protein